MIEKFEEEISNFFGSSYAVATDSCTHAIELCLRLLKPNKLIIPTNTYISIPFTAIKLNIPFEWQEIKWEDYYQLTENIYDAAVLWQNDSYIKDSYMCLSFQFKKHLSLGRGGAILLDNYDDYNILKKMSYDGRDFNTPWKDQNINIIGYHYYMTPEIAKMGLDKLEEAKQKEPTKWAYLDYPYLPNMEIFKG